MSDNWTALEMSKAAAEGAYVLTATVIEAGDTADTLDLQFEGDLGRIDNVPVHYHCQDAADTAGGGEAFTADDVVNVLQRPDLGATPSIATLTVIGFADGLPRECRSQCVYVTCGYFAFVWNIARGDYEPIDGITSWPVATTNTYLTSWLASHPTLTQTAIWSLTALTEAADAHDYGWPGCSETDTDSCDSTICQNAEVYACTETSESDCSAATSSNKGGTHAKASSHSQEVDDCGDTWPGMEVINSAMEWRPALTGPTNTACRSFNLNRGSRLGYYLTSADYDGYGICTDGYCIGESSWTTTETLSAVWECHLGTLLSFEFTDISISTFAALSAKHDMACYMATRDDVPQGPVAAVQIFGVRRGTTLLGARAAADLVDPDTYNPVSQDVSAGLTDAVESLLYENRGNTYAVAFTIRR